MESGFRDPIKIKRQQPKDHPKDGKNTPWEHQQPQYDQRSSCFVNAGTHYGVGHRQPVGKEKPTEKYGKSKIIPFGRVNTMEVDEVG
jgi:hypothetical protein